MTESILSKYSIPKSIRINSPVHGFSPSGGRNKCESNRPKDALASVSDSGDDIRKTIGGVI